MYLYLISECTILKNNYSIDRNDYPDFWTYFRSLYEYGFQFDSENALQSHFLFNLLENLNSPSIKHIYENILEQSVFAFEEMVKNEVKLGFFREDIPIKTMGFMLYKIGISIQENLMFSKVIEPKKSIEKNQSVYKGKKATLMQTVDDYISLIKPSFDRM